MFALNNSSVSYFEIAMMNAFRVKKHLKVPVAVVTDSATLSWFEPIYGNLIDEAFDHIIMQDDTTDQQKVFRDTQYWSVESTWKNSGRPTAYSVTPFNETIMIDVDYIISSDELSRLWGHENDYVISRKAELISGATLSINEKRLSPNGIDMYWATVVYWKQNNASKIFFDTVCRVSENYEEYQAIYGFPRNIYRNDYAFSIAINILNGWVIMPDQESSPTLLTSTDDDSCIEIDDHVRLLVCDPEQTYLFIPVCIRGRDIHIMNKLSLNVIAKKDLSNRNGENDE